MKRLVFLLFGVMLTLPSIRVPAYAWELKLGGNMYHNFEYYSHQGDMGFFGPWNIDLSNAAGHLASGAYANANAWLGHQLQDNTFRDMLAGHDGSRRYYNVELRPEIRINPALRLSAKWRLVTSSQFGQNDYIADTAPGVDVAMASGFLTMFRADMTLPWGILVVGKRPDSFGMGLHYNQGNASSEGVALFASYGPFRVGWAFRPWRMGPSQSTTTSGVPNNTAGPELRSQYLNDFERNDMRAVGDTQLAFTYRSGCIDMGARYNCNRRHYGPESLFFDGVTTPTRAVAVQRGMFFDYVEWHGCAYFKYFDGRFFFNTEVAHNESATYRLGQVAGQFVAPSPRYGRANPSYIDSWRWAVEVGAVIGPSRITAFYAFLPGQDRRGWRNGNMRAIDKQPFTNIAGYGMHSVFRPYTLLMGPAYGSGVNAYDFHGHGYINEACVLALRSDYAVAANLNVYGTFLWAERSSKGHAWGFIRPFAIGSSGTTGGGFQVYYGNDRTGAGGEFNPADANGQVQPDLRSTPNIPDTGLGYEITAGADWELLDGFMLNTRVAYFVPGKWWSYACVDRSVPGWNAAVPSAANNFGTNPQRWIDPVFGLECNLNMSF